jgi:hypothetical protein
MKKEIKSLLFFGYVICALFFLAIAIIAFIIKPSERILISFSILLPTIGFFGMYAWLYKKELQQKLLGRIVAAMICVIFCIISIYHFREVSENSIEKVINVFSIFLFGSGGIIFLLPRNKY